MEGVEASDLIADRPTVWIELGGGLSRLDSSQDAYSPATMAQRPSIFSSSIPFEKLPLHSFDEDGRITIEPAHTSWSFVAAIQYGRSSSKRKIHQQTHPANFIITSYGAPVTWASPVPPQAARFADTLARTSESHLVLDFQAGKDVGLGILGEDGSSVLKLGVRFAQFQSKSNIFLKSDPDWAFHTKYYGGLKLATQHYHSNRATLAAARSFRGIGPELSWTASAPFAGSLASGQLAVDWGIDAAVLFGRQRVNASHQTTSFYHSNNFSHYRVVVGTPVNTASKRERSIIVPNIGGFAGASWRLENISARFGYRADFFFGAMDGGIDQRKPGAIGFHGPFVTIGIGLGG